MDHLYLLVKDVEMKPNPEEVMETKWVDPAELRSELAERPEEFTPWFKVIAKEFLQREDSIWNHIHSQKFIHPISKTLVYTTPLY